MILNECGNLYVGGQPADAAFYNQTQVWPMDDPNFLYIIESNNEVTILNYNGNGNYVRVPKRIEGYPVTKIEATAFNYQENVQVVFLPNNIIQIG